MARRPLLDEMFPGTIADQLCGKGCDVQAVVTSPEFTGLPDEEILIGAAEAGRAVVTANVKDFISLDARTFVSAVTNALSSLLAEEEAAYAGEVIFLSRG